MLKISLSDVKNGLKRDEMIKIIGGCGGSGESDWIHPPGMGWTPPGTGSGPFGSGPAGAGTAYNNEQSEIAYVLQAIGNGVIMIGSGLSWLANNVHISATTLPGGGAVPTVVLGPRP